MKAIWLLEKKRGSMLVEQLVYLGVAYRYEK